jgi:two-component sensor histidine kinase/CHASE1-domain containing sensor protein
MNSAKPVALQSRTAWRYAIPAAVFLAGLTVTAAATLTTLKLVAIRDADHFQRLQSQVMNAVDDSFDLYSAILRGAAGMAAIDEDRFDPAKFSLYAQTVGVPDRYPGLRGLGYVAWMGEGAAPEARSQARAALKGVPFWPDPRGGDSAVLAAEPLKQIGPLALGTDVYREPIRRAAMQAARALGEPRLSAPVAPAHNPEEGPTRLLLYLPVNQEAGAGQARFSGWVFASFSNLALFDSTLSKAGLLKEISVRIYDAAAPDRLIYASDAGSPAPSDRVAILPHELAGRRWVMRFSTTQRFEHTPLSATVLPIGLAGLAVTFSVTFASWLQASGLQRARQAEAEAKAARDRSALLMGEVNHRVANSLHLVTSLVALQASQISDQATRQALMETRSRIVAVARVHERLYVSDDVNSVALQPYLASLVSELGMSTRPGVRLALSGDELSLATDKTVSLGIVVAELVTNALKYAYPGGEGEIRIILSRLNDRARLTVEDDGVGLSPPVAGDAGHAQSTGLGMRIVTAMAKALKGELSTEHGCPGHRVRLDFPCNEAG